MKIAVVFSGQGAQKPGMGISLYENNTAAKAVFDKAPEEIKDYCFNGTEEQLSRTEVTQPCVYTVTMAAYSALVSEFDEKRIEAVAGFSLGEYAALTASGVLDFADGISLVSKRGIWMSECAVSESGMCATIGKLDKVLECVEQAKQYGMILPVNYNCPGQTVVAGEKAALEEYMKLGADAGLRVVPLKVSGAFHSPMMAAAADKIGKELAGMSLGTPKMPIYSNVTGEEVGHSSLPDLIKQQVMSPVLWEKTIRNMISDGIDTIIEVGVGTTLCGLTRRIDKGVKTLNVEDIESLTKTISEVNNA